MNAYGSGPEAGHHTSLAPRVVAACAPACAYVASYRILPRDRGIIGHRIGPLPNVLLTTIGRTSGKPRTRALTYIQTDGLLALVASNFGSRTAPQWYRNLEAHPEATVQLKRHRWSARARPATPDERERIWPVALAIWPAWAGYAERARREIPIIVLEPAARP